MKTTHDIIAEVIKNNRGIGRFTWKTALIREAMESYANQFKDQIHQPTNEPVDDAAMKYATRLEFDDKNITKAIKLGFVQGARWQRVEQSIEHTNLRQGLTKLLLDMKSRKAMADQVVRLNPAYSSKPSLAISNVLSLLIERVEALSPELK